MHQNIRAICHVVNNFLLNLQPDCYGRVVTATAIGKISLKTNLLLANNEAITS